MYKLAQDTASYRERGLSQDQILREIRRAAQNNMLSISTIKRHSKTDAGMKKIHDAVSKIMGYVRSNPLNEIIQLIE